MTQFTFALVAVGLAVAYVSWATWKTWFGASKGCGSGCGKCGPANEPAEAKGRIRLPQV